MDLPTLGGIFLIGLSTGGLSCLAVQGGLLATAITRQVEVVRSRGKRHSGEGVQTGVQLAQNPVPVLYFLGAKVAAYVLAGALLGVLGSFIAAEDFLLTSGIQGVLYILAGLFMLATALNMMNIHPIFRYVAIQPPKRVRKMVREQANSAESLAPALLGFLTVFIPCGVTQSMEVRALSSSNALQGAAVMAAFTLGTIPTFLIAGSAATQIRGKFQRTLAGIAAMLILVLGFVSINSGLTVLDSPLAPGRIVTEILHESGLQGTVAAEEVDGVQVVTINVMDTRYSPNAITARAGEPVRIHLITNSTYGCTRAFTIPSLGLQRILPDTGETVVELPPQEAGVLHFTCSMGMYSGAISFY